MEKIVSKPKALTPGLRPEAELLLCCARTCIDAETAERIKLLLGRGIDWVGLIRTAIPHGMLPFLYWGLNAACAEAVPKATLDQLRRLFDANAERNLFLSQELLKLLNLLDAHGVRAIPFKGPALAASAYGSLSLRQFSDLDILIHERDVPRVKRLLVSSGYLHSAGAQEALSLQSLFIRDGGEVVVDLNWGITPKYFPFPLDFECLWGRVEPIPLGGTTIPSLSPEDLLLILCVHGSKHYWEGLQWICDVAELVRSHQEMDWEEVFERAGKLRSERMLALGLFLANDLLGATVPEDVLKRARADGVVNSLAARVRERLFCEADDQAGVFERLLVEVSLARFHLRVRERLRDKLRYGLHLAHLVITPTAKDRAVVALPEVLSSLYYLVRPVRLVKKIGLIPLTHLLKRLLGL